MTWDLTSYFPAFDGPEMLRFKEAIRNDIAALQQAAANLPALNAESMSAWEDVLLRHEDLLRRMSHLGSYVGCLASSDARNEAYLKEEAELTRTRAELAKVRIELLRAFKESGDEVYFELVAKASLAGAQNYFFP
jgi:oligoendopeptidase F